ncbi:MAG TPA: multidrug efflux SMR transporter [Capillimicrobium sp.]|nr:multidrug efflux SMR transporter [Capillimicrobium sp.]
MSWVLILVGGVFETVWALALKKSDGLTNAGPSVLFAVALVASMAFLALGLRGVAVGPGYAVWTGTGAVGAALAAMVLFGEPATAARIAPIALIAAGIVWLALGEGA